MKKPAGSVLAMPRRLRCATYTRKSSEEGLDMEFNSLDAQREACEAYIASQKAEGWVTLRDRYDDGGFSGGTLERPALQRLLADIEAGLIDVVVVYKIDRLSRALMDFARLVEVFDRHGVTFVSVTQSFNTTTSIGRLTLNILLSFAQFEREVIGERIRDKFAASRKRGMWMGGFVPMGYDVLNRKLLVNDAEAATVRMIFERFVQLGSATALVKALVTEGVRNKRGKPIDKGFLYKLLNNRIYICDAVHKGTSYPGEHAAIIDQALWDKVHGIMQVSPRARAAGTRNRTPALLKGLIFGPAGSAMTPTATKKGSRLYRYYASMDVIRGRALDTTTAPRRLPAEMVENAVIQEIRRLVRTPEIVAQTVAAARREHPDIDDREVVAALHGFDAVWSSLFPAEQARIVGLLVERVTITGEGIAVDLRTGGLGSIVRDMLAPRPHRGRRMTGAPETIRIVIPLTIKRRNGRPRILPPADIEAAAEGAMADPKLLRALARAWDWRRRLERGEAATLKDIAQSEGVTVPFISRFLRLAYLSPEILERLLIHRQPCALSLDKLAATALVPWHGQPSAIFDE